ncbi:hypothetical protein JCM13580A_32260 [Streptomyces drozdowiczii]
MYPRPTGRPAPPAPLLNPPQQPWSHPIHTEDDLPDLPYGGGGPGAMMGPPCLCLWDAPEPVYGY